MKQFIKSLFKSRRSMIRAACVAELMAGWAMQPAQGTTFVWTNFGGAGNFYDVAGNWSPVGGPPVAADSILFNAAATYGVTFDNITGDRTVRFMDQIAGSMTLLGTGATPHILTVTGTGSSSDFSVIGATTVLNINGMNLNVGTGGEIINGGTINVSGASSALSTGSASMNIPHGTLRFQTSSQGHFNAGLNLGENNPNGANLFIESGSDVDAAGLAIGNAGGGAAGIGGVNLSGSGSSLTITGASTLTIGNAANLGAHTMELGGGDLTTGTGQTTINRSGRMNFNGGFMNLRGNLLIDGGVLDFNSGGMSLATPGQTITVRNNGLFDLNSGFNVPTQHVILESGGDWVQTGSLSLGASGSITLGHADSNMFLSGTLNLGGLMTINSGSFSSSSPFTSTISGTGRVVQNSGTFSLMGDLTISGGRYEFNAGLFSLASGRTLSVNNNGVFQLMSGMLFEGGRSIEANSGGDIISTSGFTLNANTGNANFTINNAGSSLTTGESILMDGAGAFFANLAFRNGATGALGGLHLSNLTGGGSQLLIEQGAQVTSLPGVFVAEAILPSSRGFIVLNGAGSKLTTNLLVVGSSSLSEANVEVLAGASLVVNSLTQLNPTGVLRVQGGSASLGNLSPGGRIEFLSGSLSMNDLTLATGQPLGDFAILTSDRLLTVHNRLKANSGSVVHVAGSVLNAGSLQLQFGASLLGNGVASVNGAISASSGTLINLGSGHLSLGSSSKVNGFYSNGDVEIEGNTLSLLDANDAVFDSAAFVSLSVPAGGAGTLNAANGLTLDFGGNIVGFGSINTPNDPARPLINNGHLLGDSAARPLTLTGYVKGVGTLANVVVTGTLAPGLSPTILRVDGSLSLASGSSLEIEVGGATPGTQYDQVLVTGAAGIDGMLFVELENGFTPGAAQTFNILAATSATGQFTNVVCGRVATNGGTFEVLYSGSTVTLANFRPSAGILADFNFDGRVDNLDLDIIGGNVAGGSSDPMFDMNGDSLINRLDIDHIVADLLGTFYGDANLNCSVSIGDLTILAENFNQPGGWAKGDFTGNGIISIGDLTLLAENFGNGEPLIGDSFVSANLSAVPLPPAALGGLAILAGMGLGRSKGSFRRRERV